MTLSIQARRIRPRCFEEIAGPVGHRRDQVCWLHQGRQIGRSPCCYGEPSLWVVGPLDNTQCLSGFVFSDEAWFNFVLVLSTLDCWLCIPPTWGQQFGRCSTQRAASHHNSWANHRDFRIELDCFDPRQACVSIDSFGEPLRRWFPWTKHGFGIEEEAEFGGAPSSQTASGQSVPNRANAMCDYTLDEGLCPLDVTRRVDRTAIPMAEFTQDRPVGIGKNY